jgi:hypothetical protein
MKEMIQYIISKFGARIARIPQFVEPMMPFDVLELAIERQLTIEGSRFYFVRVGANDGAKNDSLNRVMRKLTLRGCLIEPAEDVSNKIGNNYQDQSQLDFLNWIIIETNDTAKIYRSKQDASAPAVLHNGLARPDAFYIQSRVKSTGLTEHNGTVTTSITCSFESLVMQWPVKHISMLYVDTQGNDDKIVNSTLRAGVYPAIIQYEWSELPLERRYALKMMLLDYGYRFIDIGASTVCLRNESAAADY